MTFDLVTQTYWCNVDIYLNTPFSAILYSIQLSWVTFSNTSMIHICTKFQVNFTFFVGGDRFRRFSQIITIQENRSWWTLWVLEAFLFLMKNEACTPSFRRIGAMGWKWHHSEKWTCGRGLWRPLCSDGPVCVWAVVVACRINVPNF